MQEFYGLLDSSLVLCKCNNSRAQAQFGHDFAYADYRANKQKGMLISSFFLLSTLAWTEVCALCDSKLHNVSLAVFRPWKMPLHV